VFAARAVSRWIEDRTGWSIRRLVRTARRYRTIEIQAGTHTITAADPLPDDLRDASKPLPEPVGALQFGPSRVNPTKDQMQQSLQASRGLMNRKRDRTVACNDSWPI
jgi:hypothetical protein